MALPVPGEELTVVSPHFDDAVLSCGHLLAMAGGTKVVTVFTAGQSPVLLPWDRAAGFARGDDVMAARAAEDRAALALVGATPHHMGFHDSLYRAGPEMRSTAPNGVWWRWVPVATRPRGQR